MAKAAKDLNRLYYGNNLDILKAHVEDESVDLVYLDPPFNSNRDYSVIFSRDGKMEDENAAQIEAFEDTWHWTTTTEKQYNEFLAAGPGKVVDALSAFRQLLGENDAMAYLVNMAPRMVELQRVLKPKGSLYLHCDPTMSHYLKILLDAVFLPENFINEVIWKRTSAHNRTKRYGPVHDVLLVYGKSNTWTWNKQYTPYTDEYIESNYRNIEEGTGRRYATADLTSNNPGSSYIWKGKPPPGNRYWGVAESKMREYHDGGRLHYTSGGIPRLKNYLDEMPGMLLQDVWTDINPIGAKAAERLGYPTQKPLSLIERIIIASSNPGDVVLDPFCGCGTTVDAAQQLGRKWIGIDITYIAVDLIAKRLRHTYGDYIEEIFAVDGIPRDQYSAQALFDRSPFDFERWAVSMINAQPNQKQVGDEGKDGVARFPIDAKGKIGRVIVSVKGGKVLNPAMVRELKGTVESENAQMGVLITIAPATKGVTDAINRGGIYTHPANGQQYPLLQHVRVAELLAGKRPEMPPTILPYIEAKKQAMKDVQSGLF